MWAQAEWRTPKHSSSRQSSSRRPQEQKPAHHSPSPAGTRRCPEMPRLVKKPPEDVPLARHTQRAGFTRQVKRKAGREDGPKTAPSLLPTNQTPYSDSAWDWGGDSAAAHSEGPDDTDTVNKHSHTAAGSAENGAPHDTGHEDEAMPKEDDTGTGGALATANGHETACKRRHWGGAARGTGYRQCPDQRRRRRDQQGE